MKIPHSFLRRQAAVLCSALFAGALVAGCVAPPVEPPAAETPPAPAPVIAVEPEPVASSPEAAFARWVASFRDSARAAGIGEPTLQQALGEARYLPGVIESDRAQPEFTRPVWAYLDTAVSAQRVARGQEKLAQVRREADAAAARFGVAPSTLVAIWGIESNYGTHYGDIPVIDALATLGFEGRREAWAREQLMAALTILQNGDIDRARMIGSWAGAMGQTQFIPTVFLAHAVDADGDGRRDIWGSMADVTASTANFIAHSGWQSGQRWGTEVRLPAGFDPGRADADIRQPSAQWEAEGVRAADGGPLPAYADGAILQPAGARGPAFLVGPNFRAILRYNNSVSYALAVSLLAQRIDGGPAVQASWPRDLVPLTRSQMTELQAALNQRGFDTGAVDGQMGPATRAGLRRYQRSIGLPADGYPVPELLDRLRQP
jgi:lytic murein transglycosylase